MINEFTFTYREKGKEVLVKRNFPLADDLKFMRDKRYYLFRDIYSIACIVFTFEKILKKNRFIENITIPVNKKTFKKVDFNAVGKIIENLFIEILNSDVSVKFEPKNIPFSKVRKKKFTFKRADAICLFSGGVDSFSGLLNAQRIFPKILPLFIAHSDQQGMISIVKKMDSFLVSQVNESIKTIHAPPINKGGYSQLRGFLYFILAGLYAKLSKTNKVIITECGPTMYQPRFAPMDEITFTTHPFVLSAIKKILDLFFGDVEIIIPFENMTKAEVISASPNKQIFSKTHSCISQRSRNHDGTCYGCVIRKLGALVAGVSDTDYNYDVLSEDDNPKKSDNFISLMNFCYDILFNYEEIPDYSKGNLDSFDKKDLFERFALDNFSALYLYFKKNKHKISDFVKDIYLKSIQKIGEKEIEEHIKKVRSEVIKPNFLKKVK